jgi:hypothetical protein
MAIILGRLITAAERARSSNLRSARHALALQLTVLTSNRRSHLSVPMLRRHKTRLQEIEWVVGGGTPEALMDIGFLGLECLRNPA